MLIKKLGVTKTTDNFKLSVAVKPLSGSATSPDVIPTYQPMEAWSFGEDITPNTDDYSVKGIADGDRFAISPADEPTQKVYVVDKDATGILPASATGLTSADFYIDGNLAGTASTAPYCYEVPLESGNHTLKVIIKKDDGISYHAGTYSYSADFLTDTNDSVIQDFESGSAGENVTFDSQVLAETESCTYQTAPGTGSMAMAFSYDGEHESGASNLKMSSIAVPTSKLVTLDYDFYSANSSGNMISQHLRNSAGPVVTGYTFGTLPASKYSKDTWHHASYVFDFNSLTYRGYLDGYEFERGTLNNAEDAYVQFYLNRYSVGTLYIDNFKYCGKEELGDIEPITYAVKGITDGERIPVGPRSSSLMRTLSVVNADATGKIVTEATNLAKAVFYIDGVKTAAVTSNPCQWSLPVTDLKSHTLTVETTDIGGNKQIFGPFTYTAVSIIDGATSHTEYFEGTAGDSVTLNALPRMKADASSTENPVYAIIEGSTGTSLKLTGASGKNTNFETAQDIHVQPGGITTIDLDFYCTSQSSNNKLYFRSRNSSGFTMKSGDMTLIDGLSMSELADNTWHHISFVFDISRAEYAFAIDGYEFERGAMDSRISDRTIYFQIATQNYGDCEYYFDNLEIMSKSVSTGINAGLTDEGTYVSAIVLNGSDSAKTFDVYRAEYIEDNLLVNVLKDSYTVGANGIWQGSQNIVDALGEKTYIFIWDYDLVSLCEPLVK